MKSIKTKKAVWTEVELFEAEDGTVFQSETECIEYELKRNYLQLGLREIERCPKLENYPPFDSEEHKGSNSYEWFKPIGETDIDILNGFYDLDIPYSDSGKWICIEVTESSCYFSRLEDSINYAKTVLTLLGISVEELLK